MKKQTKWSLVAIVVIFSFQKGTNPGRTDGFEWRKLS